AVTGQPGGATPSPAPTSTLPKAVTHEAIWRTHPPRTRQRASRRPSGNRRSRAGGGPGFLRTGGPAACCRGHRHRRDSGRGGGPRPGPPPPPAPAPPAPPPPPPPPRPTPPPPPPPPTP